MNATFIVRISQRRAGRTWVLAASGTALLGALLRRRRQDGKMTALPVVCVSKSL